MNRSKQQHNIAADHDDDDDDERKNFQMTTVNMNKASVTHLEDLSNEIVYEIFDFLDMYHVYDSFSNLNIRLQSLVNCSILPIKINTAYLSKSNFQRYYTQFIIPNINRISSLHLWNSFIISLVFSSLENIQKFIGLKILILNNIISMNLLDSLTYLPNLSSLIINQLDCKSTVSINFYSIIRLPALKYCKISCAGSVLFDSLHNTSNELSPLEHLVINGKFDLNRLPNLLSCVPNLHRLSIDCLCRLIGSRIDVLPKVSDKLTYVSFKLEHIKFNRFEPFIMKLFPNLQVLRISTRHDIDYLDANRWQRLILSYMDHLRVFDIQYLYQYRNDSDRLTYDTLSKQFTSSFWVERQWYFGHQYRTMNRVNDGMFYSIQPYRRRYFKLNGIDDQHLYESRTETNFHLVRHVDIQNRSAMENCSIYFPNANELTISKNTNISRDTITTNLNRILPSKQLNQIIIDCDYLDFAAVVKMLHFTPNCCKLILNSIALDEEELPSLRDDAIFRLTSNTNKIRDVTVKSTCTLEEVKLLVKLCPRLEHLTIKVSQEDFTSTIKFLLSKSNKNTRHLLSLYIQSTGDIWIEKVMNLLHSVRRSDEFSIKDIDYHDCYLWW